MSHLLFNRLLKNDYQLHTHRVDVIQFPLSQIPLWTKSLLDDDEQQRASRFYFPKHQRRFTVARAVLKAILGKYLQQNPHSLAFQYNLHGKPSVTNSHALQFNLSHSCDLALLAIGKTNPLGIDVEFFSDRPYDNIANQMFSPAEVSPFLLLESALKPFSFFHVWAQKEAFIKSLGIGLSYPTQSFTVPIWPNGLPVFIQDSLTNQNWKLLSFMPKIAACASICVNPMVEQFNFIQLETIDDLLP